MKVILGSRSFGLKLVFLFCIGILIFGSSTYVIFNQLIYILNATDATLIVLEQVFIEILVAAAGAMFLVLLLVLADFSHMKRQLFSAIKQSLESRNLGTTCADIVKGNTQQDIIDRTQQLLQLYDSFSQIKSHSLTLWINTNKALIRHINEGVILFDNDMVVSHINHTSEEILGLLPSEIIGQSLSRKINNEDLLDAVRESITDDVKIIGKEITIKEETKVELTVLPVKNKSGQLSRGMILLKQ